MEQPEFMKPMIAECQKEFGITDEEMQKHAELPKDKKCFHFCLAKKIGYMDKDGNVLLDAFKKTMGPKLAPDMLAAVDKCSDIKKDDPCLTAEAVCACVHKT